MKFLNYPHLVTAQFGLLKLFSSIRYALLFFVLLYTTWKLLDPTIFPPVHALGSESIPEPAECEVDQGAADIAAKNKSLKKEHHIIDFEEAPIPSFFIAYLGPLCIIYWIWWLYDHSNWK